VFTCVCIFAANYYIEDGEVNIVKISLVFLIPQLQHEYNSSARTGVGTPIYMSPEIILGGNRYDPK
jgi:serine/threonine protein kinase